MTSWGVLEDSVGGGTSQLATTLYEAAFFAGAALIERTPHYFCVSRCPMARGATISWGGRGLIWRTAREAQCATHSRLGFTDAFFIRLSDLNPPASPPY
jgi:VanW like protein